MSKVNALVLAAVAALAMGVVGCGGGDKPADAAPQPSGSAEAAPPADSAAPAEAAPADSAAPAAADSAAPAP